MLLDTGAPRSVLAHAVSGGVAGLILGGVVGYGKYKSGKILQQDALKHAIKAGLEGALVSACAIGAANSLGSNKQVTSNLLESGAYLALGLAGTYAIQNLGFLTTQKKLSEKIKG